MVYYNYDFLKGNYDVVGMNCTNSETLLIIKLVDNDYKRLVKNVNCLCDLFLNENVVFNTLYFEDNEVCVNFKEVKEND